MHLNLFRLTLLWLIALVAPRSTVFGSERHWTLMVYAAVDNNAEEGFVDELAGALQFFGPTNGMELVILIDRSSEYSTAKGPFDEDFSDTRLYRVTADGVSRLVGRPEFPEITLDSNYEANTADPAVLGKFIRFAKRAFPARWYGLVLYGHANGRAMLPDEQAKSRTSAAALREAIRTDGAVDLTAVDLCSMGGIETAYEWRPGNGGFATNMLVAIPSAGEALPWHWIFRRVSPPADMPDAVKSPREVPELSALTPKAFADLIVEETSAYRWHRLKRTKPSLRRVVILGYESAGAYDLRHAEQVKRAVDRFAANLHRHQSKDALEALRGPAQKPKLMQFTFDIRRRWAKMPYFDLADLARRVSESEEFHAEVRRSARSVVESVDSLVTSSFGMRSLKGFSDGRNGIYIMFPDGDEPVESDRLWHQFSWHDESHGQRGYGHWAFSSDGATPGNGVVENWFELLDAWYDDDTVPDGGLNRYEW